MSTTQLTDMLQLMMYSPFGQVAQAVTIVEAAILERDVAARMRLMGAVTDAERRAAAVACVVSSRPSTKLTSFWQSLRSECCLLRELP